MHIRWEKKKQDIEVVKQDIEEEKQNIEVPGNVSNKTKQHIQVLFDKFGYELFWGRTEVMNTLFITASPASALIKRMLEMKLIYPMKGKGKGKYIFRRK